MFKKMFGKTGTSKADLVFALATAIVGVWKAFDTVRDYRAEQLEKEINA